MKVVKNWLISHFGFSQSEMNGTIVLIILIILTAVVPRIYFQYQESERKITEIDQEKFLAWAQKIEKSIQTKTVSQSQNKQEFNNKNFTSYKKKEYLSTTDYSKTKNSKPESTYSKAIVENPPPAKFDINLTTAEELIRVKGIGPVLSERIVKFRDRLGGFQNINQLDEVYGLKPEVADELKSLSFIEFHPEPNIPLNTDSLKLLMLHPYIDYRLAKQIINYRRVHGNYQDISDLQALKLLSDSLYQKLYPYLSLKD